MKKIENNASITIVENKKVTCGNCLISEKSSHPEMVVCNLNPDPTDKHAGKFCAQGMWLVDSDVVGFKEAFKKIYDSDPEGKEHEKALIMRKGE